MFTYDLAILGAGPGGYTAALYAAQLGMKVCLIEKAEVGGECLNWGCIPTKAFAASAKILSQIRNSESFGIKTEGVKPDYQKIFARKEEIVKKLKNGLLMLIKSGKIDLKNGKGVLSDKNTIKIGNESVSAKNIIIAAGSAAKSLPGIEIDGVNSLTSREALNLKSLPDELVIIGGGAIGCEFASIFVSFGVKITIMELMQQLIPESDNELAKRLEAALKTKGIDVRIGQKIEPDSLNKNTKILISIGRAPNVDNLGLEKIGLEFDKKGIKVNNTLKTNIDNIYAIGDCIGGYMFAHTASYEATIAVNNISGKKDTADYRAVPYCIFTDPDIASSGISEIKARATGIDAEVSKFFFRALGKAHALGKTEGFIKMVTEKNTNKILGVDIMGEGATELIAEATLAIKNGNTAGDLARTIHAHPTMAEALLEVAHLADKHESN